MARANPGIGHNDPIALTDDERADLVFYYGQKIRAQLGKVAEAKAVLDTERDGVKSLFASVKADLLITRKDFEALLTAQDMSDAEFRAAEAKRLKLYQLGGLPVGVQLDMFAEPKDTVDEAQAAYRDGHRAGVRGDDGVPPPFVSPVLHQDWLRGWGDGQAELAKRLIRAEDLVARIAEPSSDDDGVSFDDEDEEDPTDPEVIAAKARALKNSDFMDRTAPEQEAAE